MTDRDNAIHNSEPTCEILIIGAGMAGLTAASDLQQSGYNPLVIDKGRGVGGRMASRRIGRATFDHGAQFMTASVPRFVTAMEQWQKSNVVGEWFRTSEETVESCPRWRGNPAMTSIPKHLSGHVDVLLSSRIISLHSDPKGWKAMLERRKSVFAEAVLLTPPVPQSLALLDAGEVLLPSKARTELEGIEYDPCLAVMAVLDGPTRIPEPGYIERKEGPIAWIADNQMKGVSEVPAVTIHATAAFSRDHWEDDRQKSGQKLLRTAEAWLGSGVIDYQVHGWLYSKPVRAEESLCRILSQSPPLVLAGDAFAGPSVEGASISGWSAADSLKQMDIKKKGGN
jgi:predicted NAD/FAD-dependent oxidoreductase